MVRRVWPAGFVAAGLMLAPAPALAHGGHGGGDMDCCQDEAKPGGGSGGMDCCAEEGAKKDACCEAMEQDKERRGMMDHHGMMGHHGMMWRGLQFASEIRYLPVFYNSTNQWLILSGGLGKQKNDVFSLGFQRNLAIQTFNNGPTGFWLAPYGGIMPRVGYTVGDARADLGLLVGAGAMARTANVGGTADVMQARLMWVLEPRAELMWQGDGHGLGLTATYLMTQHMADLGGFTFGLKGTFGGGGGKGKGMKGKHDHKGHHGDRDGHDHDD